MTGSEHNDEFIMEGEFEQNQIHGTQGITNGEDIYFRVAFKPTATIFKEQETVNKDSEAENFKLKGVAILVLFRDVPIVENTIWLL